MNKDHNDVKKEQGSLKKQKVQGATRREDRRDQSTAYAGEAREGGQPSHRVSPFLGVPVVRQTVIAVFICCIVFLAVGFALFSAAQKEINDLKNDLKAYTADGVVAVGAVDESINLCIEAIGARVDLLENLVANSSDGTMSNSDYQWFGNELAAVKTESTTLGEILDEVEVNGDVNDLYNSEIQEPLAALQTAYDELEISDDDMVSTNLGDNGAATDTGSFKLQTGITGALKWVVILAIFVVFVLLIFLFRKKIGNLFGRLFGKKSGKNEKRNSRSRNRNSAVNSELETSGAQAATATVAEASAGKAGDIKKRNFAFDEPQREVRKTTLAQEKEADPLDLLAPSFRKMAEMEKSKAAALKEEPGTKNPPIVSEEDLMDFDPKIDNQSEIDDAEDPLFTKGEEE